MPQQSVSPEGEQQYHPNQNINTLVNEIPAIRASDLAIEQRIHQKSARGEDYSEETMMLHENNETVKRLRQQVVDKAAEQGTDVSALIQTLR